MNPSNPDPKEQAFIEQALAGVARAQRRDQIRVVVATAGAVSAAIWFAFRPPSPELKIEATTIVVLGFFIGAATAKLRSLIQHNTRLVLQALAAPRSSSDSLSPRVRDE